MKTQTFGIEIETTGLGRDRAARAIAAHFGTTARYVGRHLGDWKVPMPDGRHWTVESDASVTDPDAEVVSPVCRWEDIPMVQEVVRALRRAGAMTDESCGTVFGYCSGEPTSAHQESSEDIQVILADRAECKRILREENVAIMCAYMLMHFIADEGDPLAFLQKE